MREEPITRDQRVILQVALSDTAAVKHVAFRSANPPSIKTNNAALIKRAFFYPPASSSDRGLSDSYPNPLT